MDTVRARDLIALDSLNDSEIENVLETNGISLKRNELERIRVLLGRNPTLVELHIFNTMWSEHCSYKSSRPVLKEYLPTSAPHVVLGPGEDAGIIRFAETSGGSFCLVMAHESHNHPSQVLPVEGAATGIGGIVRDVYCMGADVIGVLDPLRFGDPDGPNGMRVRDIARGVVDGIAQYGNPLGVPNLGGETYFDPSFDDNCLVNVVALGIVEEQGIIRSRVPAEAASIPYEVVLIGKPTDASGFGGAAFASERLSSDEAVESHGAVQVPDPFLKRVLAEGTKAVLDLIKKRGVSIGFKDLGAGGISCAVSEMAAAGGMGAVVDLDAVNRSSDLLPSEVIACSETQERYAMVAPASLVPEILRIYNEDFEMPGLYTGAGAYVIGRITADKRFKLVHGGPVVCDADVDAITTGIEYRREARKWARKPVRPAATIGPARDVKSLLLSLLASHNIAEKELIYRHYDTEVQGRAVLRPGEADAAVQVLIPGGPIGVAAGIGGNSALACADPYLGGVWSVCEAVRNVACVGAVPLAITDCLNYGDPEDPGVFWEFSEGVRGIGDACRKLRLLDEAAGIPVISGNVSFYNQSERGEPIAPSPIVCCAGRIEDISRCGGMGFKEAGSRVVLLGRLHEKIGGSEFERLGGSGDDDGKLHAPPEPDFQQENAILKTLLEGVGSGMVLSAHDISQGGILVTVAEMILGGPWKEVGCVLELKESVSSGGRDREPIFRRLFSEYGGIVIEVPSRSWESFEGVLRRSSAPWMELGRTAGGGRLAVELPDESIVVERGELADARRGTLQRIFGAGA
jgi:phosphoribosylformylglycinamidine synthase II